MKTKVSKTKALTVSTEPVRCKLEIQSNEVEQIMKLGYLGKETIAVVGTTSSP
jgi:hypothetical protein